MIGISNSRWPLGADRTTGAMRSGKTAASDGLLPAWSIAAFAKSRTVFCPLVMVWRLLVLVAWRHAAVKELDALILKLPSKALHGLAGRFNCLADQLLCLVPVEFPGVATVAAGDGLP